MTLGLLAALGEKVELDVENLGDGKDIADELHVDQQ
jgi:hypothetical protein